jgi:F0F1-type ATP synthase delta subunit
MAKIPRTVIAKLIAERSMKPISANNLAQEIAAYLVFEGRTNELDSLLRDIQQYRADNGILEVNAITANKLDASTLNDLKARLSGLYNNPNQIIVNQIISPSAVAGIRVEMANQLYDASVRTKLNQFKQLTTN